MFKKDRLLELAGLLNESRGEDRNSLVPIPSVNESDDEDVKTLEGDDDAEKLDEVRVRNIIRNEIRSMLRSLDKTDRRSWILSRQRPSSNSSPGHVSRGFLGPGFM